MCREQKASTPQTPIGEDCTEYPSRMHHFPMPSTTILQNSCTVWSRCACGMEFSLVFKGPATVAQLALLFSAALSKAALGHMTLTECVGFCVIYKSDIIEWRVVHPPPSYAP